MSYLKNYLSYEAGFVLIRSTRPDSPLQFIINLTVRVEKGGHPDLKTGRIRRDERDIHQIWDLFQTVWKDPFDEDELCNLATAVEASQEVKRDLLGAYDKGIKSYDSFVEERFLNKTKVFEDNLPKIKLKIFDEMNKKSIKIGDKVVEMKVDRNLFAKWRLLHRVESYR